MQSVGYDSIPNNETASQTQSRGLGLWGRARALVAHRMTLNRAATLVNDGVYYRPTNYRTDAFSLKMYCLQDSAPWRGLRTCAVLCFILLGCLDVPWRKLDPSSYSATDTTFGASAPGSFAAHVTPLQSSSSSSTSSSFWALVGAWGDLACVLMFIADGAARGCFTRGWFSPTFSRGGDDGEDAAAAAVPRRRHHDSRAPQSTSYWFVFPFHESPLALNAMLLCVSAMLFEVLVTRRPTVGWPHWAGLLRPVPLFYYSEVSRLALANTVRTVPRILNVVALEWFIILVYACVCFLLGGLFDSSAEDSPAFAFRDLAWASVNLFELSTTVNDPDVWLPLYAANPWFALVFISFLLVLLYFIHNLVIATVYEVYSESLGEHNLRRSRHREVAFQAAFDLLTATSTESSSLQESNRRRSRAAVVGGQGGGGGGGDGGEDGRHGKPPTPPTNSVVEMREATPILSSSSSSSSSSSPSSSSPSNLDHVGAAPLQNEDGDGEAGVSKSDVMGVLAVLRPHYPPEKLEVLFGIVAGPLASNGSDYAVDSAVTVNRARFSAGMVAALSKRVHSRDPSNPKAWRSFSSGLLLANTVAVVAACSRRGFVFCTAKDEPVSGRSGEGWCDSGGAPFTVWALAVGMVALAALLVVGIAHEVRLMGFRHYLRNGKHVLALASTAASVAAVAAFLLAVPSPLPEAPGSGVRLLLGRLALARCIDMVRLLTRVRLSSSSEYLVATIGRVLPAMEGQAVVVFALCHLFAWAGMLLYGGAFGSKSFPEVWGGGAEPFYWLLNFNSYREALVTLFAMIVVNNWNVIAGGYFEIGRGRGGVVAYSFFIVFNVIVVQVALNVMTAFYINAFSVASDIAKRERAQRLKKEKYENADAGEGSDDDNNKRKEAKYRYSNQPLAPSKNFHVTNRFVDESALMEKGDADNNDDRDDDAGSLFASALKSVNSVAVKVQRVRVAVAPNHKTAAPPQALASLSAEEAERGGGGGRGDDRVAVVEVLSVETVSEGIGFSTLLAAYRAPPWVSTYALPDPGAETLFGGGGGAAAQLFGTVGVGSPLESSLVTTLLHPQDSNRHLVVETISSVAPTPPQPTTVNRPQNLSVVIVAHEFRV